ncbi:MAG: hypothetical protein K2I49_02220, partial [Ureaplasma sp.]|nr:hypothetical protein [Ureaplasma sp.]
MISDNLYTSNNSKLPVEQINSVSYINENLRIDLNPPENVKYSIDNNNNVSLLNNIITVSNFTYFTDVKLTKLDVLYNAIQNFIVNKMFTLSEFEKYINENLEDVKRIISNNLFISNVSTISETLIESVSYENNQIKVMLSVPDNIKYSAVSYVNATLNDNILSISNLRFFTTNLLNPTNLQNAIQNAINTQKATTDEFNAYVESNQIAFKTLVANNISGLSSSSQISNIRFNNSAIEINLTSSAYTKFAMSNSNANVQLSNNLLIVSGLRYFSDTSLLNLNNLYNSVQDLISSERLTSSEFTTYVNQNQRQLKDLVSNNLWVANNVTISSTEIGNIEFTGNSLNIWISPRSFTKYNLANDINWSFENNILSLKNFTYYS